ncbi:retrovirus-related pol polyprotein from transposon TNT 1-94 [Tanacetum coccineum]|uniref:Retrovirus-related pol polyprotein from transposon TNT 1-94 n=1 Tax=Tanacetum coccineum TaxID=301880 RepID=A0ABQ4X2A9_9ASTR
MAPRAVLIKTDLRPLNTARHVHTAHPKTTVYNARPMSHFSKSAQSTLKRLYKIRTTSTNKNFSQKVSTSKGKFYTSTPKTVNTARPNSAVVNAVRANQGHPQKEDQGYVDNGCSRHITGNMSYLSNFKEFNGGYVTFGGEPNEGKLLVKELLKLMCDKNNSVLFTDTGCFILSPDFKLADESQVLLKVPIKNNMCSVDIKNIVPKESLTCLVAKAILDESMLWHRRLGHVNFKTINKLVKENLVRGLPSKHFKNDQTYVACLKGKQHKASCKSKIHNFTTQPLFMLHMDLFGPTFVSILMNKKYCLVVTDDYGIFTWIFFLASKDETSGILKSFITVIENLVDKKVKIIRCDNRTKFKNKVMSEFCKQKGIKREYSVARTSQQNGVAERRNRTLIEAARTMLADSKLPTTFWAEAEIEENLHISILEEDKPIIAGDGPKWLFDIDILTKSMNYVPVVAGTNSNEFVGKEESIGIGHSSKETGSSQDYILMPMWKDGSLFDSSLKNASNDEPQPSSDAEKKDDEVTTAPLEATHDDFFSDETEIDMSNITATYLFPSTPNTRIHKDHSLNHVIGDVQSGGKLMKTFILVCLLVSYPGKSPKKVIQALKDPSWIEAMQEELLQFNLQQVWTLVDLPHSKRAIGTKWVYRNKKDERGIVIRNKARLVAQGYTQEEGIYYDEVFAPVYASFKDFVVYQMDAKSAILYGKIEEEVYIYQPPGFEDLEFLDRVYKVDKPLYGLHQAPRAWYETLSTYLLDNGFQRGPQDFPSV